MVHFLAFLHRFQCPAIHFAVAGLIASPAVVMLPGAAAANEYGNCTRALLDLGLGTAVVTEACATALHPEEVSGCVVDVAGVAAIEPLEALSACSRDRRPDEVATCVTAIHQGLAVTDSSLVLKNCHLSILPKTYSECVVGLGMAAELPVEESLGECIAAGYQPEDVAPSFIPAD